MSILEQITADMKNAMKAKDKVALTAIRALKTAITNAEKGGNSELSDTDIISIIRKQVKQRQDSIIQYSEAGRPELAEIEEAEISILEKYLPQALSEDEVKAIIQGIINDTGANSMADMGKVMKAAQEKCQGRAEGKLLSQLVKASLSS